MDRHFHSGLTDVRSYDFAICSLDQQLPVCMVFIISSHTVHTLQVRAIVWILCVGESVGPNRRTIDVHQLRRNNEKQGFPRKLVSGGGGRGPRPPNTAS